MRWNRFLTAVLLLSFAINNRAAWGEDDPEREGLVLLDEDGSQIQAPVLGATVEVRMTGIVARARVTQVFQNPTQEWLEGIYLFPLPDGAAVDTLRMAIGDRVVEGILREKEEARQTYETAKRQGTKAALVEMLRPGIFTTSLANIGPGETVEVAIELQQIVRFEQGRFVLRFPMVVAPRYTGGRPPEIPEPPVRPAGAPPINPFAFHVDLSPGFPLGRVESPTHAIAVERGPKNRYAVDLADGAAPADGDFVLEWRPSVGREPRAVFFSEEVDGERYALLMVMPPDVPEASLSRLPRETVFVIDTSGSMEGPSIEQARQALVLGLDRLQPADWFNVVQFNSTAEALFPDSVPANPATLEQARQYIQGLKADGGTEMLPALEVVLRSGTGRSALVQQVIFATDGQVSNEADILRYVNSQLGDHRLFTVALGFAPNVSFLRKAAEIGRGSFTQIVNLDRIAEEMGNLLARLEAPMLRQIEAQWADPAAEAWPERVPDLYLGEPLVVTAKLRGSAGPVTVSGLRDGEPWQDEIPAAAEVRGAGLDKLWAQRKIESLTDSLFAGADPQEVRRAVTELGLRHHLVTDHTSLVAVDVEPTAPAGVQPATRLMPVNPPGGSIDFDPGDPLAETITVMGESPLLDERRISTVNIITKSESERIPGHGDVWAILQATPSVLTDRISIDCSDSGRQPIVMIGGAATDQNEIRIDGLVLTGLYALPSSPSYFDFDSFEEVQVDTGGADATLATPGTRINLTLPRGTNEWRSSGQALWGGEDLEEDGRILGIELGGPLRRDRFWGWGSLHHSAIDRAVLGGQTEEKVRTNGTFKLSGQPTTSNSVNLLWSRGGGSGSGVGAAPYRSPETSWNEDGRENLWKAELTQIFSSNLYLSASWGAFDNRLRDVPRNTAAEAWIDPAGVAHGSWFSLQEEQRTRTGDLRSSLFFNIGSSTHETTFGAQWRDHDDRRTLTPPGSGALALSGEPLGLASGLAVSELWRSGEMDASVSDGSLWAQDLVSWEKLTATFGLRYDVQDLGIPAGGRPSTLSPRLGLTHALDDDRRTLLRASLSRFASRLGTRAAFHLDPAAPAASYSFLADGGFWYADGLDPALPGFDPDTVDPELSPEITDEASLGIERAVRPEMMVGLRATWRRSKHLLEERLLVRDVSTGAVSVAEAGDWIPAGRLDGALPDGTPYWAPVFDLRPGLEWTGGRLLTNGDRRQESLDLSLYWQKRLANRWMSRGHVTWHDWTWRLGPDFVRFDDPTNTSGSGDDDGQRVIGSSSGLPHEPDRLFGSRWSFHLDGLVQLPWDFEVSMGINGREGSPLPYYRQIARDRAGIARVQLTGRANSYRTDDLFTVDLRLGRGFHIGDLRLALSLEAFNLLDERTVLERELDLGVTRATLANETLAPRTFRLGLRVEWR